MKGYEKQENEHEVERKWGIAASRSGVQGSVREFRGHRASAVATLAPSRMSAARTASESLSEDDG